MSNRLTVHQRARVRAAVDRWLRHGFTRSETGDEIARVGGPDGSRGDG
jgi:hypothetical protein